MTYICKKCGKELQQKDWTEKYWLYFCSQDTEMHLVDKTDGHILTSEEINKIQNDES